MVFSLAYEEMCGLPAPLHVEVEEPSFDESDNSNSVAVDEYTDDEDSDSGNKS